MNAREKMDVDVGIICRIYEWIVQQMLLKSFIFTRRNNDVQEDVFGVRGRTILRIQE